MGWFSGLGLLLSVGFARLTPLFVAGVVVVAVVVSAAGIDVCCVVVAAVVVVGFETCVSGVGDVGGVVEGACVDSTCVAAVFARLWGVGCLSGVAWLGS